MSDWNLLRTEDEFEIIKKHSDFGRFYTMLFTCEKFDFISRHFSRQYQIESWCSKPMKAFLPVIFMSWCFTLFEPIRPIQLDSSTVERPTWHVIHKKLFDISIVFVTLAAAVYSGLCLCVLVQFGPNILDFVAPRNKSRPHHIPITAEYFVDQQRFYLPILLHIDVIAVVGFTTVMSTESLFAAFVQHAIGMFEIAR